MKIRKYELQLFAEGGAGEGAAAGTDVSVTGGGSNQLATGNGSNQPATGEGSNQLATGKEQAADPSAATTEESFEDIIRGRYAKEFNAKVSEAVNKRMKNAKAAEVNLGKLQGSLLTLGEHYGLDVNSPVFYDMLNAKIMDDEKLYEDEALAKGMDVSEYKRMKRIERDNMMLRAAQTRQAEEAQKQAFYQGIMAQVPQVQALYKNFDIDTEMSNPQFFNLVKNGVSVQNAYEVLHHAEMQAARDAAIAAGVSQQISNSVAANKARPSETGINNNPASGNVDISKMSAEDFRKMNARAARGEKITFAR